MKTFGLLLSRALLFACVTASAASAPKAPADLADYRTARTAITTQIQPLKTGATGLSGYLGVSLEADKRGSFVIAEVGADSPAAKAGVQRGDVLVKLAGKSVKSAEAVRAHLQSLPPGEAVKLSLTRGRKSLDVTATLGAITRPMKVGEQRAILGVRMAAGTDSAGIAIASLTTGKPAANAGLRINDVIVKVDGVELSEALSISDALAERKPGDRVRLLVRRGKQEFEKTVELAADDSNSSTPTELSRPLKPWKKSTYRLAIIRVEFPDTKHNDRATTRDWEDSYFSRGTYTTTNATGQKVHGSMNDYYLEQSCGQLSVAGKVFEWVEMKKPRADYNQGTSSNAKTAFYTEALDAILARDGTNALADFDGLGFIYAGDKFPTQNRGSLYWPHRSSTTFRKKAWPYVIISEGGPRMANISTMSHETGHILGLPDLYARPENPGSEGAGTWCAMSNQARDGRPQHFSAWCKEQLGWITPVVIDPAVKQKLILAPIEGTTNECYKILVRSDGSEYFLLENRRKQGFDASLPAEGLLIWRVVGNRPILEEAHGVEGPPGPRVYLGSVPFPSKANHSFTPYTKPSSRSQLGGGAEVFLSNIRQLGDGRVAFEIGYAFE